MFLGLKYFRGNDIENWSTSMGKTYKATTQVLQRREATSAEMSPVCVFVSYICRVDFFLLDRKALAMQVVGLP